MAPLSLNVIYSVHETPEHNVYIVKCNLTDYENETYDADYFSRPNDAFGLNPAIRQWIADHPEVPVVPYAPSRPATEDERRTRMPALTARQFRLGLVKAGVLSSNIGAAIAAIPPGADREKIEIEWEYATTFKRTHPLIATIGAAVGLTDDQIDELWQAAVNL